MEEKKTVKNLVDDFSRVCTSRNRPEGKTYVVVFGKRSLDEKYRLARALQGELARRGGDFMVDVEDREIFESQMGNFFYRISGELVDGRAFFINYSNGSITL